MFIIGFIMFLFAMFLGPFIMTSEWFEEGPIYIVHIKMTIALAIDLAIGITGLLLCR
jgi:hypothetical protein